MRRPFLTMTGLLTLGALSGCGSDSVVGNEDPNGFWGDFVDDQVAGEDGGAAAGGIGGGAGGSADSDGDGLTDAEEADLGTDPNSADSDGDGWDDLEEVEGNTNPTKKRDHPYTGGWDIGACRHDLSGTGTTAGDTAYQFELTDQYGDTLKLHDFCHKEVLLVGAAFW